MLSSAPTERLAPDVLRIPIAFVNVYAIGQPHGVWVLVDTGLPGAAGYIQSVVENEMGSAPEAILLTHGHFDHASNAYALAERWGVPVYAHREEMPFLTGKSDYPPADSSMGGAIAHLARVFPASGFDLKEHVRELDSSNAVPHLPQWRWLHTPGHTAGHVSLWRESDRLLIAGDALATMDLDSWVTQVTHERELARPPVPFTPDWDAAEASMRRLAELAPAIIGAGHGRGLSAPDLAEKLKLFAAKSHRPAYGRYAYEAAEYDPNFGVMSVPPPVFDKAGLQALTLLGGVALGVAFYAMLGSREEEEVYATQYPELQDY